MVIAKAPRPLLLDEKERPYYLVSANYPLLSPSLKQKSYKTLQALQIHPILLKKEEIFLPQAETE
ncbi:hypothetical protein BREVNS_1982 [Brevinematales bacterium NS]|nr:hypothetical protein BREVNS_1982 [Brevinematales bacterium NS]